MERTVYHVYIVCCADGTLYTGWTTGVDARVATHNAGRGAKYTKSRLPVKLVYSEALESKTAAMKREYEIKRFTRAKKLELIENRNIYGGL
jgi:putative endonuclease